MIPNYSINLECTKNLSSDDVLKIQTAIDKWNLMKSKREISYKEYTNWKLTYNFEDGIKDTVDWYLNNQDWINDIKSGSYKEAYKD